MADFQPVDGVARAALPRAVGDDDTIDAVGRRREFNAGIAFSIPWVNYRKYSAATKEARSKTRGILQTIGEPDDRARRSSRDLVRLDCLIVAGVLAGNPSSAVLPYVLFKRKGWL